jgi:hypothetical protein
MIQVGPAFQLSLASSAAHPLPQPLTRAPAAAWVAAGALQHQPGGQRGERAGPHCFGGFRDVAQDMAWGAGRWGGFCLREAGSAGRHAHGCQGGVCGDAALQVGGSRRWAVWLLLCLCCCRLDLRPVGPGA